MRSRAPPICRPGPRCRSLCHPPRRGRAARRGAGAVGRLPPRQPAARAWRGRHGGNSRRCRDRSRCGARSARSRRWPDWPSARSGASRSRRRAAPNWPRRSRARSMRCGSSIGAAASSGRRSPSTGDAGAQSIRQAIRGADGPAPAMRRWSRPRRACAARWPCSSRNPAPLAALSRRVKDGFDPRPYPQPRPHGRGKLSRCRPISSLAQLADSGHRGIGKDPARLRPLRLLHRDLPDLCAARRRTRQPARPHLSDQEHARRGRPGARRRDGHAYRPLSVVPRLHDDLPVGRQLHAPRRSRPAPYRGALPPAAGRAAAAPPARSGADAAGAVARRLARGASGEAVRRR